MATPTTTIDAVVIGSTADLQRQGQLLDQRIAQDRSQVLEQGLRVEEGEPPATSHGPTTRTSRSASIERSPTPT